MSNNKFAKDITKAVPDTLTPPRNKDIATIEKYAEYQENINSPTQILSYFYDKEGNEPLPESQKEKILHDLRFPKDKATMQGESQSMQIYVRNNLERNIVELSPYTRDKHLTVTEYPEQLNPREIGKIRVTFAPTYNRYDALDTTFGFNIALRIKE